MKKNMRREHPPPPPPPTAKQAVSISGLDTERTKKKLKEMKRNRKVRMSKISHIGNFEGRSNTSTTKSFNLRDWLPECFRCRLIRNETNLTVASWKRGVEHASRPRSSNELTSTTITATRAATFWSAFVVYCLCWQRLTGYPLNHRHQNMSADAPDTHSCFRRQRL